MQGESNMVLIRNYCSALVLDSEAQHLILSKIFYNTLMQIRQQFKREVRAQVFVCSASTFLILTGLI